MNKTIWAVLIVIVLIIAGVVIYKMNDTSPGASDMTDMSGTQNINAVFTCDAGKSINATFMQGESQPPTTAGGPPIPGGSVHLVLSDGRDMILPQTISADGARYANADESFVFWNKGNGAFVQENGTTTYNNCVTSTQ